MSSGLLGALSAYCFIYSSNFKKEWVMEIEFVSTV